MIILTEGHTNPHTAKTASCLIRYRPEEVLAILDSTQQGRTAGQLLQVGSDLPVIGRLDEAPGANSLLLGIAPPGGRIPASWRGVILQAIQRGLDVLSGLHDFLNDDPQFAAAARAHGVQLIDIRKNQQRQIARQEGIRAECLRVHTVGHDCSVGKMVAALEIARGLQRAGHDAKFLATGQTGILVAGDGCPIDCVVADFVAGAAERLVLDHQHHELLVIEGQGSLVHPSYSGVTLGLLHGCQPHALVLCYEVGRETVTGFPQRPIPPLEQLRQLYETMASLMRPCAVVGIAMNSRLVTAEQAERERAQVRRRLGLPVCDVLRDGPDELVRAVLDYRAARGPA